MIGAQRRPDCRGRCPARPRDEVASNEHGFSLMEVIVALAIVAIGLAAFSKAISSAVKAAQRTRLQAIALADVQSHLGSLGVDGPLDEGRTSGRYPDGLHWRLDVAALSERPGASDGAGANPAAHASGQIRSYWVILETFTASGTSLVKLQTAKLAKPAPRGASCHDQCLPGRLARAAMAASR